MAGPSANLVRCAGVARVSLRTRTAGCGYALAGRYLLPCNVAKHYANNHAQELEACRSTGLGGRELGGSPGPAADAGGPAGAARLPGASAQLDPVRYAQGLAAALERRGARLTLGDSVAWRPRALAARRSHA